jgi:multiple sugar transport system permease protein
MSVPTLSNSNRRRRYAPAGGAMRKTLAVALAVGLSVSALLPIVWLGVVSFMPQRELVSMEPTFFAPTLDHYRAVFSSPDSQILRSFLNSAVVSLASTAIAVVCGVLGAYAVTRMRPRGHRFLAAGILATRLLPPLALVVPMYIGASKLGVLDTRGVLILPYAALGMPLAMWIVQGAFLDLPKELEEAAFVDGCGKLRAFYSIVLPLTVPAIAAAAVMSFILAWNDLLLALPLTLQKAVTLPVLASQSTTDVGIAWGNLGATTMIMVLPIALFTYFAQRWIVSGLTAGATKG